MDERLEDNIKMDLKEIGSDNKFNMLRIESSDGLL
jgi:hypothetical protein